MVLNLFGKGAAAPMDRYRQRAIRLQNLFPWPQITETDDGPQIGTIPTARSHFGGRPALPAGTDWPRASDGVPLHFVAAIDLAEMPTEGTDLPGTGCLSFFLRICEGMEIYADRAQDDCRVIYDPTPDKAATPADLPDDLPALPESSLLGLALPDEPAVRGLAYWPVIGHALDTWPESLPGVRYTDPGQDSYRADRDPAQAEAEATLPAVAARTDPPSWHRQGTRIGRTGVTEATLGAMPDSWSAVQILARHVRRYIDECDHLLQKAPDYQRDHVRLIRDAAEAHIRLALDKDPQDRPSQDRPADAPRFGRPMDALSQFRIWLGHSTEILQILLSPSLVKQIDRAMVRCLAELHSQPALADQFLHTRPEMRDSLFAQIASVAQPRPGHQLLGHSAHANVEPWDPAEKVALLNLVDDPDLGIALGGCEVLFWISPKDLKAGRFDRVRAELAS